MVSLPPCGIASRALTTRFMRTCSSADGSAHTGCAPAASTVVTWMCSSSRRRSIFSMPETRWLRSTLRTAKDCARVNASSWRVSCAAREPARTISATSSRTGSPACRSPIASSAQVMMTDSTLLKSWATPAATLPIQSILWAWRSLSSSCRLAVMSSEMPSRCRATPASSRIAIFTVRSQRTPSCVEIGSSCTSTGPVDAQRLAILRLEEVGLLLREEVVIRVAEELRARAAQQLLARTVHQLEPQLIRVLDEDHQRQVVDDRTEEVRAEGTGPPSRVVAHLPKVCHARCRRPGL